MDNFTPKWVTKNIREAKERKLSRLDLSGLGLSAIPLEITQLTHLEELSLSFNKLETLPDSIAQLTNLRALNLRSNDLRIVDNSISKLVNLRILNLSYNKISSLPDSIGQLRNLEVLDLSNNQLAVVANPIGQLSKLKTLVLNNNRLNSLSDTVGQLKNLEMLDLNHNQVTTIANAIGLLSKLEKLDLSNNRLTTLPDTTGWLKNLKILNLGNNRLVTIPESVGQLTTLSHAIFCDNQLTTVPDAIVHLPNLQELDLSFNNLTALSQCIIDLPKQVKLYLDGNLIKTPPPEVLKLGWGRPVDLGALRVYFRQQVEAGREFLYEAKLLIVGEPGAGKTSLTRKLLDPTAALPAKNESTDGIDVCTWVFPLTDVSTRTDPGLEQSDDRTELSNPQFRVNIWDFGGQEIYHATHQFFLSRRSLYIIVADAREQKADFFYWLNLIEHLSDRSPVLIFNNEIQGRHWIINEQQLHSLFPDTLQKTFAFNLANDFASLNHLRQKIQLAIATLPHVGDVLPRTWVKVREALENDPRATVTLQDFLQLCHDNGFTRTEDALQLSQYLHDLGVILHFQEDPLLKYIVILKPEWGTGATYRVLDSEQIKTNFGNFSKEDLKTIWQEKTYANLHDELLALMMKFQLCYEIPDQAGRYIAPQLLTEHLSKPYPWNATNNLHLRYKYETFMPKGLLARFIVVMHPFITNHRLVWRTGVVLLKDNTAAEVVEFYPHREIRIRVSGKHKKELLTIIDWELEKLHAPFHHLKFDKLIPCNCSSCQIENEPYFHRLEDLQTRLDHGREVIECNRAPFIQVKIRALVDDIGLDAAIPNRNNLLYKLEKSFSDEDLKTICFELDVNYDDLQAQGRQGKMRELIKHLEQRSRLLDLEKLIQHQRPTRIINY